MTADSRTATTSKGGRPPEYRDRVRTSLDIERDLLAQVDAEAARRDLSRAKVLNLCIERGLPLLAPIPGENGSQEAGS